MSEYERHICEAIDARLQAHGYVLLPPGWKPPEEDES